MVHRALVAVALILFGAPPFDVPVCGVGVIPAPTPQTCADELYRCVFENPRPRLVCAREFAACIGPWEGPQPGP